MKFLGGLFASKLAENRDYLSMHPGSTTPVPSSSEQQGAGLRYKYALFLGIILLATFLRLWNLAGAPFYEWDEPIYSAIGSNVAEHGLIQTKQEIGADEPVFLYHPPFHFLLLGQWFKQFGSSIESARTVGGAINISSVEGKLAPDWHPS